nr:hypothetical protein [Tanacetum cinerariifolium]
MDPNFNYPVFHQPSIFDLLVLNTLHNYHTHHKIITSFYQNLPFKHPYNNPNDFHNSPTGLYHPTMKSSTSSQPNQFYSPINPTNLDMNFEELIFSQDYNYSQDYSMGHGSAHGLAPVQDDEDDSHVEEVSPVKPKKTSRRALRAKKDELNEPPKDWTMAEETALCQA